MIQAFGVFLILLLLLLLGVIASSSTSSTSSTGLIRGKHDSNNSSRDLSKHKRRRRRGMMMMMQKGQSHNVAPTTKNNNNGRKQGKGKSSSSNKSAAVGVPNCPPVDSTFERTVVVEFVGDSNEASSDALRMLEQLFRNTYNNLTSSDGCSRQKIVNVEIVDDASPARRRDRLLSDRFRLSFRVSIVCSGCTSTPNLFSSFSAESSLPTTQVFANSFNAAILDSFRNSSVLEDFIEGAVEAVEIQNTVSPSTVPSLRPSLTTRSAPGSPGLAPTVRPSMQPSSRLASEHPSSSFSPSSLESVAPRLSSIPTLTPSREPSENPNEVPSNFPSKLSSSRPSLSSRPSSLGSRAPTLSLIPSVAPINLPSPQPSFEPSIVESNVPSLLPIPSDAPSADTSSAPSLVPSDASVPGLLPSCAVDDPTRFNLCLDLNIADAYANLIPAFTSARDRWESIIVGDVAPAIPIEVPSGTSMADICSAERVTIDDIYICADVFSIDGQGGVLGFASPMLIRNGQTLAGIMRFDSADVSNSANLDVWVRIILHEMAHVLGIGSLWQRNNLHSTGSHEYNGTHALEHWRILCGPTATLPVEQDGDSGTADGHWDEACLQDELMTGYLGSINPISNITIGAFEDAGFVVDYSQADDFTLANLDAAGCNEGGRNHCPNLEVPTGSTSLQDHVSDGLLGHDSTKQNSRNKPPLGKEGENAMKLEAGKILGQARREHESRHLDSLPEGVDFVGGDVISIVYGKGDYIYEKTFYWDDVKGEIS